MVGPSSVLIAAVAATAKINLNLSILSEMRLIMQEESIRILTDVEGDLTAMRYGKKRCSDSKKKIAKVKNKILITYSFVCHKILIIEGYFFLILFCFILDYYS